MSSEVTGYDAFCQDCLNRFELTERFSHVVNLDIEGFEKERFLAGNLNRVVCPKCKCEFTYEIPMIVFSMELKFACLVYPNLTNKNLAEIKDPPHIILPNDFMFRVVRYQIEALEKYRMALCGINDVYAELLKLKHFTDDEAMPFDERNIVFSSFENGICKFNQVDCNNNILKQFEVTDTLPDTENKPKNFCRFKWLKIDRETLKEDGICQN